MKSKFAASGLPPQFLKSRRSGGAGGLALPAVHAAGSGIIRVGVIGCGGRGEALP